MTSCIAIIAALLPVIEMRIVNRVSDDFGLTREETALMVSIRRAENGRSHIAFGVADPRCRTYEAQARWTANTIRRRWTGDVDAFARRWCPLNAKVWARNVRFFMRKQGF